MGCATPSDYQSASEKMAGDIVRTITRSVDGLNFSQSWKSYIYLRLAMALLQESQFELIDSLPLSSHQKTTEA